MKFQNERYRVLSCSILFVMTTLFFSCRPDVSDSSETKGISADNAAKNVALLFVSPQDLGIESDVDTLKSVLEDPQGDYKFETYTDAQATSGSIVSTIKEQAGKVDSNGTLFLYIAGHGSTTADVLTQDGSFISSSDVVDALKQARNGHPFKRFVFFVFACNSGSWVEGQYAIPIENLAGTTSDKLFDQALLLSSSQNYETSWTAGDGSSLALATAQAFTALKGNKTATLGDFAAMIKTDVGSSTPDYRALPQDSVLNDKLLFAPGVAGN